MHAQLLMSPRMTRFRIGSGFPENSNSLGAVAQGNPLYRLTVFERLFVNGFTFYRCRLIEQELELGNLVRSPRKHELFKTQSACRKLLFDGTRRNCMPSTNINNIL